MIRDLGQLVNHPYDLLVIGGGIYGACLAWEATLRGLSVALVEKGDFGSATSSNSMKVIHGGFRYLQHGDFKRMRQSVCERQNLMRIAPHLVHPLPVLIPSYRHWTQRKELLRVALAVNDLIGLDRNRVADPQKHIPPGCWLSKDKILDLIPGIDEHGLTGGMLFHDAQVYNSERLLISFLRSASDAGAYPANYLEATGFLKQGDQVIGIQAKDILTGALLEIQARTVVNTCGPWINKIRKLAVGESSVQPVPYAKAVNLIATPLFKKYAVGIVEKSQYNDSANVVKNGNRLFFIAPWRKKSLVGTAYFPYAGDPDDMRVTQEETESFLSEVNQALPSAGLEMTDISLVHCGLVPRPVRESGSSTLREARHPLVIDHQTDGLKGAISVVGVKYTTARAVAEKTVDRIFENWGQKSPRSTTAITPLYGGNIERFEEFLDIGTQQISPGFTADTTRRLILNYGSAYQQILDQSPKADVRDPNEGENQDTLRAETLHALREEMALKLSDVVFRRTELGTAGYPGAEALKTCAETMAAELGWSASKTQQELNEVENRFPSLGVRV